MERKHQQGITALCHALGVEEGEYRLARFQARRIYVEKSIIDRKNKKVRELCYPPHLSALYALQSKIKEEVLESLPVVPEIRGYIKNSHNINTAADVCGYPFMGKVDISKFHPSISPRHVAMALAEHGLSSSWSREIARLVTYKGKLPQGAPTSNHVANAVMDSLIRRFVKPFADKKHVQFRNFGDDIAFYGSNANAVRACVKLAKKALGNLGFQPNEKCRDCEHRGERREFIGCATGRDTPDYPRKKYRAFRRELRALIHTEQNRSSAAAPIAAKELNSLKHRIAYVRRLNPRKARRLLDLFYRLCRTRRSSART
jgi:RNA-directed DNA polymerase